MAGGTRSSGKGALWYAAMAHRVSGVALAVFLPLHFLALGLAIESEARLDAFLHWAEQPLVRVAETLLVALLAVHLLGGLRVLVIENLPWRNGQKSAASLAAIVSLAIACLYVFVSLA